MERFEVSRAKGWPVQDADLLDDLRRVAQQIGSQTVTQAQYSVHGCFDKRTLERRFGSWNESLRAAGLDVSNEVNLSDEKLFENILVLWQYYGRQPRRAELSRPPSTISQGPYRRRFKSWVEALGTFVEYANSFEVPVELAPSTVVAGDGRRTGRDPSLRLRFKVLQRDCFRCQACGASPATDPTVHLHVDHVVPWSGGGDTSAENLQTLCSSCNLGKSNLPVSG